MIPAPGGGGPFLGYWCGPRFWAPLSRRLSPSISPERGGCIPEELEGHLRATSTDLYPLHCFFASSSAHPNEGHLKLSPNLYSLLVL